MPRTPKVLIPTRPPRVEIELGGANAEANYYLFAFAERDVHKATYDLLIGA